jgi:signal transduction histidine kinase
MSLASLARSVGFRLAIAHAALFAVAIAILFWIVYWATSSYTYAQLTESIRVEGYELVGEASRDGAAEVADTITDRLIASGEPNLAYLLTDAAGNKLAGNLQPSPLTPGWHALHRPANGALGSPAEEDTILAQATPLPGGGMLVVGADTHPREELLEWIVTAFSWAAGTAIAVALAGGLALGLAMSRRVDAVNLAAARIIDGDLGERIAVRGTRDEFDRLAVQLNRMLERIQGLMEGLRQVSNDIAHDLRTPLARLRQNLEWARDRSGTVGDYELAVDRAIDETDAILATFAALLRIAQIEAGTRSQGFKSVDLSELGGRIHEAYGAVAEDQGRQFDARIEPGVCVRGDPELLTQMLANLVENALTHSPAGTPISLAISGRGESALMTVADCGPGIPEAERTQVLERFVRLDRSRSTRGNGLGLSLVAAVAELHGIVLRLEDNRPGLRLVLQF